MPLSFWRSRLIFPIRRKPHTFPDSYCAQVLQQQRITVKRAALKAVRTLFTSARIVLKELNETTVWLELIVESSLISREMMWPIVVENAELCRIIAASIRTVGGFDRD